MFSVFRCTIQLHFSVVAVLPLCNVTACQGRYPLLFHWRCPADPLVVPDNAPEASPSLTDSGVFTAFVLKLGSTVSGCTTSSQRSCATICVLLSKVNNIFTYKFKQSINMSICNTRNLNFYIFTVCVLCCTL